MSNEDWMHDTRMERHVRTTPISTEDYMMKEMSKAKRPQTCDKINKLIDHFAILNGHLNDTGTEGENISQRHCNNQSM